MIDKRKYSLWALAGIFCCFEIVSFFIIHILNADPNYKLRYVCIIAATLFAFMTLAIDLLFRGERRARDILLYTKSGNFIRLAMLFTLVADYFLVAIDFPSWSDNLTGVSIFLGTQISIFLHILANEKSERLKRIQIIIRITVTFVMIMICLAILKSDIDLLSVISVIYYGNLVVNLIFAHRSGRGGIMLTVGLILFALCDINVGLSGLDLLYGGFPEGSLLYNLMSTKVDLIWIFYIPSQTLIPLTLLLCDKDE